jgi:hypothetical protein
MNPGAAITEWGQAVVAIVPIRSVSSNESSVASSMFSHCRSMPTLNDANPAMLFDLQRLGIDEWFFDEWSVTTWRATRVTQVTSRNDGTRAS